ncbi:SDR family NAD(P)-dependent oxidoreductase [Calothrix rhizosoleniae]|uniref:SDR family NAD(P)-dependent oxidoreductase n=1 Tax=Calothrix rhizosoleniae TaxID=888997 RepID=UPI000B497CCC|nr:SDR family NAD(P)-dependent oxidoreductase [Calothrix rhizosoleniae]
MTQLYEAVVLITGAAGGFGQELTRQLLEAGSRLILTDLDENVLRQRVEAIQDQVSSGEVIAILPGDLSNREGCETLYHQVKALNIPIDILINNAGVGLFGRMDEVPSQKWELVMQVNLLAPMRLSTLFITDMIARKKGHIVNISGIAGWSVFAGMAHYATSKFGLRGFSEGLFNEFKEYNIKVTAVYPFFTRTPILQSEQYGTLKNQGVPEYMIAEPENIMRAAIRGIVANKLHVFPDVVAKTFHILTRVSPGLVSWISGLFAKSLQNGQLQ